MKDIMNNITFWLVLAIGLLILVLVSGIEQAESKTVRVCGNVNVPTKTGRCTYQTIWRGGKSYKVSICL